MRGDSGMRYENGNKLILCAGNDAAKFPLDIVRLKIKDTMSLTPIEIIGINLNSLDIMMTWNQL